MRNQHDYRNGPAATVLQYSESGFFIYVMMLVYVAGCLCTFPALVTAQEDLSILKGWKLYSNAGNALYNEISEEAFHYLDKRDSTIAHLLTEEQWHSYQMSLKQKLNNTFGPLPEKTPLNARITDVFTHEGMSIEKILFESRPGFWVTGCLFKKSDIKKKIPAVLYLSGHTVDGFRSETYQHVIMNLARKGFIVFAIDPAGQGERLQYFDPDQNKSAIGGPTHEHSYAGLQYLLLGRTMAMVRLWDGIRAIDYLVGRPDVDSSRIGVHGRSGGGTMSAYLGAMDDRVSAAAPECYITGFRRIFQSIGPQDAEQNLLGQISRGIDHGDFLIARAPKPTLVVTTTRDFFSIQGARETVRSSKTAYKAFGYEYSLNMIEDDASHMSTQKNRERVYAFFMKAFDIEGTAHDEDILPVDPRLLQVSSTGQVITSGSKNIHDLITADASEILYNLRHSRKQLNKHRSRVLKASTDLSGLKVPENLADPVFTGCFQRKGCRIEKFILDGEGDIPLPVLVFIPEGDKKFPAVLYLNDMGKAADTEPGGIIEFLVRSGYIVMTSDLPGQGELSGESQNDDSVIKGVNYNIIFGAQLIDRSVAGIQAGHIIRALRYLQSRPDVIPGEITAVAKGTTGPALLHAAVIDTTLSSIVLINCPVSWESVVMNRFYDQSIGSTIVPSALLYYDLPDLMGLLAPRRQLVVDPVDGNGKPTNSQDSSNLYEILKPYYEDNLESFTIAKAGQDRSYKDILLKWLGRKKR